MVLGRLHHRPAQRAEGHACPLQAPLEELWGLPPTMVITDEADVLRDEGEEYANKLREAGVEVTSVEQKSLSRRRRLVRRACWLWA